MKFSKEVDYPLVLVGNKLDVEHKREVSTEEGQKKAGSLGCPFFETSAKDSKNVNEAIISLLREIAKYAADPDLTPLVLVNLSNKNKKDCILC